MVDNFFDDKSHRKNKLRQDQLDKNKYSDDDQKSKHKQNLEHKKFKQEFDEYEWEYWKNFYK